MKEKLDLICKNNNSLDRMTLILNASCSKGLQAPHLHHDKVSRYCARLSVISSHLRYSFNSAHYSIVSDISSGLFIVYLTTIFQ
jgi:hypothetical protein